MRKQGTTLFALCIGITGCATTAPISIGADTYYAAATNSAGAFGDVHTVTGKLIVKGNKFCTSQSKEFELVTTSATAPQAGSGLGGASITFKCVAHASSPVMRRDNGVTTIN